MATRRERAPDDIGTDHADGTTGAGRVVESYIYRGPDWFIGDAAIKSGDWLLGTVWDETTWAKIKKGEEDFLVVMCHMLASPTGGSMFEGEDIVRYSDLAGPPADVFCFGHWHKDQGITEIAPKKHIVNVGSLSRGSLSQDDMDRRPCAVVMTFDKNNGITFDNRTI